MKSLHKVIIYINFVELESPMLHAKFQDHGTSGSGEEDFTVAGTCDKLFFKNIHLALNLSISIISHFLAFLNIASGIFVTKFPSFQVYLQISGLHVTVNSKRINKYTFNIYVVMAVYKINA